MQQCSRELVSDLTIRLDEDNQRYYLICLLLKTILQFGCHSKALSSFVIVDQIGLDDFLVLLSPNVSEIKKMKKIISLVLIKVLQLLHEPRFLVSFQLEGLNIFLVISNFWHFFSQLLALTKYYLKVAKVKAILLCENFLHFYKLPHTTAVFLKNN